VHVPLEQYAFALQLLPHVPQLVDVVYRFVSQPSAQPPLQLPQPELQAQAPALQ
jgi:hypothetical protein